MDNSNHHQPSNNKESEAAPVNDIFWRDEILQVMYWYCGEGLGRSIGLRELQTFLPATEELLRQVLGRMVEDGYLAPDEAATADEQRYVFTDWGSKEGARRFADEFAGLTDQAHGECNDPQCDCRALGPEACSTRVSAGHSH